jgi:hypothetical protein
LHNLEDLLDAWLVFSWKEVIDLVAVMGKERL